jgi:hypothetical protein
LTKFIDLPVYIINSEYDAWAIPEILGETCLPEEMLVKKTQTLDKCNATEISYIE